ncbi:MAG: STAS domain-containing protein [Terriglobales bacterium]
MLDIHTERINDVAVVECDGRIVQSDSAFKLRNAVLLQNDVHTILLDLSRVPSIEGGRLGMLMFLQRWAYDHDIRFKLFNPTKAVGDRLQLANSIPEFEIATPDEMRALLGGPQLRSAA